VFGASPSWGRSKSIGVRKIRVAVNFRPYAPAVVFAVLIFYFGVNALTGDRGLLTHSKRNAVLAQRQHELADLRKRRGELEARIRLMSDGNLSRDYLEERAQLMLGYSHPRDYVIRHAE